MEKQNKTIIQYVVYTFVLFVLLMLILGGIATTLLSGTPLVMRCLTAVVAWTPTYVFLLMFKKLYPTLTVKDYYKEVFRRKLNLSLLTTTTVIQVFIFIACVLVISIQRKQPIVSFLDFSLPTVVLALLFIPIQGPAGEETGWRGYLLPAIEKKHGIVKSTLIVSVIWAFWHAPIWFLGTGYHGRELIQYIIVFVISITSVGCIIGICYFHCKNLFVPIWIHFIFNLLGQFFTGSMPDLVTLYAIFYFPTALCYFLWHVSTEKNRQSKTVYQLKI